MRKFEGCNVEYNGDDQLFLENLIVKCEYSMPMLIEQSLAMSGHISTIEFMLPTYYVKHCIPAEILNRFGDVYPDKGVYIIRKPVFDQRDTSCYIIEDGVEKRIVTKEFANASLFEYYYLVVDDVDRNAILHVARKDCFTGVIEFLSDVKYYDMFSNPYVFLSCAYVYAATHYCDDVYFNPNDRSSGRSRSGRLLVRGGCPLPANKYVESMLYYCNSRGHLSTQSDTIE